VAPQADLLDTLLRRRSAKQLVLEFLRTTVEECAPLGLIATLFDQLNVVCQAAAQYEFEPAWGEATWVTHRARAGPRMGPGRPA
jgi:hypothetical protein